MKRLLKFLITTMDQDTLYAHYNILAAGWIGFIGHPLYWYIWVYVYPQPHDSAFLRFSGSIVCLGLVIRSLWPEKLKKFFSLYWHFAITYVLPFPFTYLLLKNDFNNVWMLCALGMILLLVILMQELVWFIIVLLTGILSGIAAYIIVERSLIFDAFAVETLPIFLFAIVVGVIIMHLAHRSITERQMQITSEKQKAKIFKSLSASIAHEVRTPISAGQQAAVLLDRGLEGLSGALENESELQAKVDHLHKIARITKDGLNRGDMVIKIILQNIKEKDIDPASFTVLDIKTVVEKALSEYAFQQGERDKIILNINKSFSFSGDEGLVIFIIFNLLRNALFYASNTSQPIEIATDAENCILSIKDYGPGIPDDNLDKIFNSFMTLENRQGTGLGLAFCKRAMEMMGGTIRCDSRLNQFTKFTLKFSTS